MSGRQVAYLVLAALTSAVLLALPAGASARETAGTCQSPAFFGQSDINETWFRLPPYPKGRNAEHIYYGNATVQVEVHDLSTEQNFRIRDLSWGGTHVNLVTGVDGDPTFTGVVCWLVPLEVRSGVESGDYEWQSDQDPNYRRGVFVNHPVGGPPHRHRRHHPGLRRRRHPGLRHRHPRRRRSQTSSSRRARASRSASTTPTAGG